MTGWLIDTNIVSQFAPSRDGTSRATREFREWVQRNADDLFLSVVSVSEITAGIAKLRREGADRRGSDIEIWFDRIVDSYGERVLSVDTTIGSIAGLLADRARGQGLSPGFADILIAATAIHHRHGVMTDNVKHFKPFDIVVINPLVQLPA